MEQRSPCGGARAMHLDWRSTGQRGANWSMGGRPVNVLVNPPREVAAMVVAGDESAFAQYLEYIIWIGIWC